MCIERLNTPEKHAKLIDKMTFPVTMYKVVNIYDRTTILQKSLGPAYGTIGGAYIGNNSSYDFEEDVNIAKEFTIKVGRKEYISGYHLFKYKKDAEKLINLFSEHSKKSGKYEDKAILPVVITKKEHITYSGLETPIVASMFFEFKEDTRKTVYVASEIFIDEKDYEKALNNENTR